MVILMMLVQGEATTPPAVPPAAPELTPAAHPDGADEAPLMDRRVHIFIDQHREVIGSVIDETDATITVLSEGKEFVLNKSQTADIVPLLDFEAPAWAMIQMRDGTSLKALVHEDGNAGVVYEIATIINTISRDHVQRVVLLPSVEQQLTKLKATLQPEDVKRHVEICRWLVQQQRADLAIPELESILAKGPNHQATSLLDVARITLAARVRAQGRDGAKDHSPSPNNPYVGRLLTDDEVNLLRVFEVDFAHPPRMSVSPDTVRALLTQYSTSKLIPANESDRARLITADPSEVLRLMFALKAREFYPRVTVESDPASLRAFHRDVYSRWLIPNCTTSRCHGGTDAGDFLLHLSHSKDPNVRATNLLILLRKTIGDRPMIDFGDPSASLLIQYGLPRHLARSPHPAVKGWTPALGQAPTRMQGDTEAWIRMMYQPRPDYMIEFEAPSRPKTVVDPTDDPNRR